MYFDVAKAFDTVPHQRLIKKLSSYGIGGNVLVLITDFLSSRRQRVSVKGCLSSEWYEVLSWVPQGSVMDPVLFVVYIKDLPEVVKRILKMFADDTKVYGPVSCIADREEIHCT